MSGVGEYDCLHTRVAAAAPADRTPVVALVPERHMLAMLQVNLLEHYLDHSLLVAS